MKKKAKKIDDTYIVITPKDEAIQKNNAIYAETEKPIDVVNKEHIDKCVKKIVEVSEKIMDIRKKIAEEKEVGSGEITELKRLSRELIMSCSLNTTTVVDADISTVEKPEDVGLAVRHLSTIYSGEEEEEEEIFEEEVEDVIEE